MPSFVATRAEMILNGILPIDQLRDHVEPINLLSALIPRHVLEDTYGIMLPKPLEGEDPARPPTSQELLNAYGCKETVAYRYFQFCFTFNNNFFPLLQTIEVL